MDDFVLINSVLYLRLLRSQYLLGKALAEQYPTEDTWEALLDDPVFRTELRSFAGVIQDTLDAAKIGDLYDAERIQVVGGQHYDRALEALTVTAERLKVDPEVLLTVLMRA